MSERPFVVLLQEVQEEGFLLGSTLEQAQRAWARHWDCDVPEDAQVTKVMLASLDRSRTWCQDLKLNGEEGYHAEALRAWVELVGSGLKLDSLREEGSLVEFGLQGYRVPFRLDSQAHHLDMNLLRSLNDHLPGEGGLEVCDALGMPNFVTYLRPSQRSFLQSRGWRFLDHLSRYHEKAPWSGYLGTYLAQGMEEGPWSIFQRQSSCRSPREGWELEGMSILQSGAQLTLFDQAGHLLWRGSLEPCKKGWFGKAVVGELDYHPPGVDAKSWQQWLYADPPLRALYTPPERHHSRR